jgi:NitT/TauT family transport system ATP-binding protein
MTSKPSSDLPEDAQGGPSGGVSPHARLRGVTRHFPTGANHGAAGGLHALGPLDLDLRRGEFFAVVGPSGCGKSTLLELLAGLATASEGTIEFEDKAGARCGS